VKLLTKRILAGKFNSHIERVVVLTNTTEHQPDLNQAEEAEVSEENISLVVLYGSLYKFDVCCSVVWNFGVYEEIEKIISAKFDKNHNFGDIHVAIQNARSKRKKTYLDYIFHLPVPFAAVDTDLNFKRNVSALALHVVNVLQECYFLGEVKRYKVGKTVQTLSDRYSGDPSYNVIVGISIINNANVPPPLATHQVDGETLALIYETALDQELKTNAYLQMKTFWDHGPPGGDRGGGGRKAGQEDPEVRLYVALFLGHDE